MNKSIVEQLIALSKEDFEEVLSILDTFGHDYYQMNSERQLQRIALVILDDEEVQEEVNHLITVQ